jgi:hypothetical protein
MNIDQFKAKLSELATNNISAMEGHIQLTANEVSDLRLLWLQLDGTARTEALELVKKYSVDTRDWK